jgi:hypothetical protein
MKKTATEKLNDAYEELKDIALELVDDINTCEDLGDSYSCFVDKELYKIFQKMNKKISKLHSEVQKERPKNKK